MRKLALLSFFFPALVWARDGVYPAQLGCREASCDPVDGTGHVFVLTQRSTTPLATVLVFTREVLKYHFVVSTTDEQGRWVGKSVRGQGRPGELFLSWSAHGGL